jgi:hypothetical protein
LYGSLRDTESLSHLLLRNAELLQFDHVVETFLIGSQSREALLFMSGGWSLSPFLHLGDARGRERRQVFPDLFVALGDNRLDSLDYVFIQMKTIRGTPPLSVIPSA